MEFSYNYLNLLQSAGETNYTYAADGTKLSVKDGSNGFDYLGSLILSSNSTEFQFGDGIISKTTGGYDVTYHLRDHLGSVRSVVNKNGDVLQQSDYYPFGLKQERSDYVNNSNRFLYNGKELQTTGGLDFMDYGARMYDPQIPRWSVMDAKAEKYLAVSPYNYALNNPFRFIDPDGNEVTDYRNQKGEVLYKTDDGLKDIIIVNKGNLEKFEDKLNELNDKGKVDDAEANKSELHSLGVEIDDYEDQMLTGTGDDSVNSGFVRGYDEGYNGKKPGFLVKALQFLMAIEDENAKMNATHHLGVSKGEYDREQGNINRLKPYDGLKKNEPIIKLKNK